MKYKVLEEVKPTTQTEIQTAKTIDRSLREAEPKKSFLEKFTSKAGETFNKGLKKIEQKKDKSFLEKTLAKTGSLAKSAIKAGIGLRYAQKRQSQAQEFNNLKTARKQALKDLADKNKQMKKLIIKSSTKTTSPGKTTPEFKQKKDVYNQMRSDAKYLKHIEKQLNKRYGWSKPSGRK